MLTEQPNLVQRRARGDGDRAAHGRRQAGRVRRGAASPTTASSRCPATRSSRCSTRPAPATASPAGSSATSTRTRGERARRRRPAPGDDLRLGDGLVQRRAVRHRARAEPSPTTRSTRRFEEFRLMTHLEAIPSSWAPPVSRPARPETTPDRLAFACPVSRNKREDACAVRGRAMTTEQTTKPQDRDGVASASARRSDRHRRAHRPDLRAADHRRHDPRRAAAPDQGQRGRLRPDVVRPGVPQHGLLPQRDHLDRRRQGRAVASRHPDRAALRAQHLSRGRLPAGLRRAADEDRSSTNWVHDITIHTFVHENIKKFVEGFRYDAHPMGMLLATVGALSTFYPDAKEHRGPRSSATSRRSA